MKRKRFVTFFPPSENVHLTKDVGQVPYILYRDYGFDSTLVCFRNSEDYPALEADVKGLKIEFIPENKLPLIAQLKYIWRNASRIDILNLYHYRLTSTFISIIYRIRNRKGIVYIKLDCGNRFLSKKGFKKKVLHLFLRTFPDILSVEVEHVYRFLLEEFPRLSKSLLLIPNGIDDVRIREMNILLLPIEKRENLIISVGTVGLPVKNHKMLLNALNQINLKDWKAVFIGAIESDFQSEIDLFFEQHPNLKDKIIFTGNISDKKELYKWYNRAKIFCITSIRESFSIVAVEALYWGDFLITTDIAAANDFTNSGTAGRIVHSEKELAGTIQELIDHPKLIEDNFNHALKISENFRWNQISVLSDKINRMLST